MFIHDTFIGDPRRPSPDNLGHFSITLLLPGSNTILCKYVSFEFEFKIYPRILNVTSNLHVQTLYNT